MNKNQEALDNLYRRSTDKHFYIPMGEDKLWKNILQELVDKSTPKMFKIKKDTDGRMIYICPNCGNILVKFWSEVETITMYNYCDNCGQALKYMGDNDE